MRRNAATTNRFVPLPCCACGGVCPIRVDGLDGAVWEQAFVVGRVEAARQQASIRPGLEKGTHRVDPMRSKPPQSRAGPPKFQGSSSGGLDQPRQRSHIAPRRRHHPIVDRWSRCALPNGPEPNAHLWLEWGARFELIESATGLLWRTQGMRGRPPIDRSIVPWHGVVVPSIETARPSSLARRLLWCACCCRRARRGGLRAARAKQPKSCLDRSIRFD